MTLSRTHFEIAYRTGGEKRCTWRPVLGQHTEREAMTIAEELALMGYKANIYPAGLLATIGMPEGWGE